MSIKLVIYCSFGGRAGKTTSLMGLCSAWASSGKRVALFETDENRLLKKQKDNSIKNGTWEVKCEVSIADDLNLLENLYNQAVEIGFDYAMADTHGASSELNNTIIASSDFFLIPTILTPSDIDEALSTHRFILELLVGRAIDIPTAILQQRIPVSRLTASQKSAIELLSVLPQFDNPMHERDAFAAMKERGMLYKTLESMEGNVAFRLLMRNYITALEVLLVLSAFIDTAVRG